VTGACAPLEDVLRTLDKGSPEPLLEFLENSARESKSDYRAFVTHPPGTAEHEAVITKMSRAAHCECQLASHPDINQESVRVLEAHLCDHVDEHAPLQVIGVSKRCCFACHLYLEHRRILYSGSRGRVAPWIPPPGADYEMLKDIYRELKHLLHAFFWEADARRRLSRDSAGACSASWDGSDDFDDL
jgi:hypothetical protein